MNKYNNSVLMVLLIPISIISSEQSRSTVWSHQKAQLALAVSDAHNPFLNSQNASSNLQDRVQIILADFEPKLQKALLVLSSRQHGEQQSLSNSFLLHSDNLRQLLAQYDHGSTVYRSYDEYIATWIKLSPELWDQLQSQQSLWYCKFHAQ